MTKDALPDAGAPADCAPNVRAAFEALLAVGAAPEGRARLQQLFSLCAPLDGEDGALELAYWAQVWGPSTSPAAWTACGVQRA